MPLHFICVLHPNVGSGRHARAATPWFLALFKLWKPWLYAMAGPKVVDDLAICLRRCYSLQDMAVKIRCSKNCYAMLYMGMLAWSRITKLVPSASFELKLPEISLVHWYSPSHIPRFHWVTCSWLFVNCEVAENGARAKKTGGVFRRSQETDQMPWQVARSWNQPVAKSPSQHVAILSHFQLWQTTDAGHSGRAKAWQSRLPWTMPILCPKI